MYLVLILGFLYASAAAEELTQPEEIQTPHCNCTQVLQSEETATDFSPTFPTTSFTCWGRYDGYYADVEVDCTIFHYCQTWHYPTGLNETVKWDFACPQSTIFNQKVLSCTPPNISFDCQDSPNYYWVNYNLTWTTTTTTTTTPAPTTQFATPGQNFGQQLIVGQQSASFSDSENTPTAVVEPEQPDKLPTIFPDSKPDHISDETPQSIISPPASSDLEQTAAFSQTTPSFGESGFGHPPSEVAHDSEAIKFPM